MIVTETVPPAVGSVAAGAVGSGPEPGGGVPSIVGPGLDVYEGMIVGENAKAMDIRVNVCKEKQLSNMRAKSDGGMEFLKVPRMMTLEESIEFIGDDELVEVTPKSIRLRKMYLTELQEKRAKAGYAG